MWWRSNRTEPSRLRISIESVFGKVHGLPPLGRFLFALSVAERMLPNYASFSEATGFGDVGVLREALDHVWSFVRRGDGSDEADAILRKGLRDRCKAVVPDIDDVDHALASAAQCAAIACAKIVEGVGRDGESAANEVSWLGHETVTSYVEGVLGMQCEEYEVGVLGPPGGDDDGLAVNHPIVRVEVAQQCLDLSAIEALGADFSDVVEDLRLVWSRCRAGSLGALE